MSTPTGSLRVLIVDDNRDGADALGLLVEALGNQVHVTYQGAQALNVATAFRPDLILVDLIMPEMNGFDLVGQLRQIAGFVQTKIIAITGLKDEVQRTLAVQAGCDLVLGKPVSLPSLKSVLSSVVPSLPAPAKSARQPAARTNRGVERRLPIDAARRLRSQRNSKALTQAESEAAVCDGVIRFQDEFLGWRSEQIHVHIHKDLLLVRILGVLTLAERQLGKSLSPEKGRDLIKQVRKQLLELARPMLESLVHEVTGVKVLSMHHDISTATGEEIVLFSLSGIPQFEA